MANRITQGLLSCVVLGSSLPAHADQQVTRAPVSNPTQAVSARARLDFKLNIGKFLFFRVGTGAYPTASSTVDTVELNAAASTLLPAGVNGNSQPLTWNGSIPTLLANSNASLPVEVRSNAGQISLRTTVSSPLTDGTSVLPFSNLSITSSDNALPAPPVPDSGTGTAVTVQGTAFANRVTERSANWIFQYTLPGNLPAGGAYNGELTFTATSP